MSGVSLGDEIAIHYRLEGPGGNVLAASAEGQPLKMRAGSQDVIIGLSTGVMGMQLDEVKALHFTPEQAYGADHPAIERIIDKSDLPPETTIGNEIRLRCGEVCVTIWVIAEEGDSAWRVTNKHPGCGMNMAITVKVVAHKG